MTKLRPLTSIITVLTALALAVVLSGCPMNGDNGNNGVVHLHVIRAGINFRTQGDFTQEQIDEILTEIESLSYVDLEQFEGYVASITIRPEVEGGLIIDLNDNDQAVIFTDSFTASDLLLDLQAGQAKAYAAQNPENGNGNGDNNGQDPNDVIVTTPTPVNNEGINFIIRAGLTQGQVTALTALINGLEVGDYAGYVETVRLNQGVEDGRIIDVVTRDGVNATAVIYINYDATIEEIMEALAAAMAQVEAVREAARDEAFWTTIEPEQTRFTHGEVEFVIAGNLLTRGEIRDITAMVEGMTLTEFAGFVTSVEFARNVPDGLRIVRGNGEQATAGITIEHNANATALMAAFNDARAQVIAERNRARAEREAAEEAARQEAERIFRENNPIVNAPQVIGGITFTLAGAANFDLGNAADRAIISTITTALAGNLNIPAPNFVTGITFDMAHTGVANIVTTTGENATSSVTMSATQVTTGAVAGVITEGHSRAASNRNEWFLGQPGTPIDQNIAGIDFQTVGNFTNGEIQAIQAQIDDLNATELAAFTNYINRVLFQRNAATDHNIVGTGATATADVTMGHTVTTADIEDALNRVRSLVLEARDGPDPFHVFTDAAGNELSFFAEEGFDYSAAHAWVTSPGNQAFLAWASPYVSSLTLKLNVEGGRQIRLNEEDPPRAVVISDGSDTLANDLDWGQAVGARDIPPTHNGPTPEPFHVFTDAAGNELSFFAEEGFDYSAALAGGAGVSDTKKS